MQQLTYQEIVKIKIVFDYSGQSSTHLPFLSI